MMPLPYYLIGYHKLSLLQEHIGRAADALLRAGIGTDIHSDGVLYIPHHRLRHTLHALGDTPVLVGDLSGVLGWIWRMRRRFGILGALCTVVLLWLLGGRVVWDVRIEGAVDTDAAVLRRELSEGGLYAGALWDDVDFSDTETRVLASSEHIAWLSIDRRGVVAYVTLVERSSHTAPPPETSYSNLVATRDAVVDELLVHSGVASVKLGDVVRKGELLISGVLPTGQLCAADGVVMGLVEDTVSVLVPDTLRIVEEEGRHLTHFSVNFFGFSLNILKNNGNSYTGCAIIEETEQLTLFGRYALPVIWTRRTDVRERVTEHSLSAEQMTSLAADRLQAAVRETVAQGDLIRIRTEGGFEDGGYRLTAHIVYRTPIGAVAELSMQGDAG